jgi:hypothetical protein
MMQCSIELLLQSCHKHYYTDLCTLFQECHKIRLFQIRIAIALVKPYGFLDWRISARCPSREMLPTIFTFISECIRFAQRSRLPVPRLRLSHATLTSGKRAHRNFSEHTPVSKDCRHCVQLSLWKAYRFYDMSYFRYTVQLMYCLHKSVQQCFIETWFTCILWLVAHC